MSPERLAYQIQIDRYGPPDVLAWTPQPFAPLGPREVRLRTITAAVNHTDLQIRAGTWPVRKSAPFPYVPGVEVVGVVEKTGSDLSGWSIGQTVITMMQGLGGVRAERPGGYATHVVVEADALALVPGSVDPFMLAALGLPGVTAHEGLRRLGDLRDQRVLVTGAAGGVGSAAVTIARAQGATVVAVITRPDQAGYVRSLGASEVILAPRGGDPDLPPESIDRVLDVVGGVTFSASTSVLRAGGALCLVGAVGGGEVTFDAWRLIRPITLTGYSTETLTGEDLRRAIRALATGLADGLIRAPAYQILPLSQASEAHRRLEAAWGRSSTLLRRLAPTRRIGVTIAPPTAAATRPAARAAGRPVPYSPTSWRSGRPATCTR
jgi:NADPH2:quinone reductase